MIVGITGGIGSGKSTVAGLFREKGIPVFIADLAGKELMRNSEEIRARIISLFGPEAYKDQHPDTTYIAGIVFKDKTSLEKLNAIIHPAVAAYFKTWVKAQQSPYVIKESAILYETGGDRDCDKVVVVTAPESVRIARVMERDGISEVAVKERIAQQWSEDVKVKKADYVIENTDLAQTTCFIDNIHQILLNICKQK